MRIFISYSRKDEEIAESLANRLATENHEVFWDRTSLPPGESFDDQLKAGIENSELFICLISEGSLDEGKYARTELKFAQQKWANPSGTVLPVVLDDTSLDNLPSYLTSVTVLSPEGNSVAEVAAQVREIANKPLRRLKMIGRVVAVLLVTALAGWFVYDTLTARPIELSVAMSGDNYKPSTKGGNQVLRANTEYVQLLDKGLSGKQHVDGTVLEQLVGQDESAVSSLPLFHYRITNSTDAEIVVDRMRVAVKKSAIDLRPLWWSRSTLRHTNCIQNAAFVLGNEGWGDAKNVEFNFDLVSNTGLADETAVCPQSNAGDRCFNKTVPDVASAKNIRIDFWGEFGKFAPASVAYMETHQFMGEGTAEDFASAHDELIVALGGKSGQEKMHAVGELSYDTGDGKREDFSFRQEIQIVQIGACVAPAMIATATYDIELRPEGENYVVEVPIAHSIDAGKTEAIDLSVWVEKSSKHDFVASIRVGEEWIDAPDALRLEYYLPVHAQIQARPAKK